MDNVIVVASGKGGTGKSTVCICLSVALVKQGKRVLLIDCDCGMRGLDIMLDMEQDIIFDASDAVCGNCTFGEGFETAAAPADRALIVTNAEPTGVRGAVKVRRKLESMGKTNIRLVINRFDRKLFTQLGFYELFSEVLPDLTGVRRRPFLTVLHRGLRENIFPLRSKGSLCGVF